MSKKIDQKVIKAVIEHLTREMTFEERVQLFRDLLTATYLEKFYP